MRPASGMLSVKSGCLRGHELVEHRLHFGRGLGDLLRSKALEGAPTRKERQAMEVR